MDNIKLTRPLVTFDLETTGIDGPNHDRIVEIAMIKTFPDGDQISFIKRVNPECIIPVEAIEIHGITNEEAQKQPKFKEFVKNILEFLEGCDISGYNIIWYDLPILRQHIDICRLKDKMDVHLNLDGVSIVDVCLLYRSIRSLGLESAYREMTGGYLPYSHSAYGDTSATITVLNKLNTKNFTKGALWPPEKKFLELHNPSAADLEKASGFERHKMVDLASKFIRDDNGHILFNFGDNKGINATDTSYLYWMINNDFTIDTIDWASRIYNEVPVAMEVPEGFPLTGQPN